MPDNTTFGAPENNTTVANNPFANFIYNAAPTGGAFYATGTTWTGAPTSPAVENEELDTDEDEDEDEDEESNEDDGWVSVEEESDTEENDEDEPDSSVQSDSGDINGVQVTKSGKRYVFAWGDVTVANKSEVLILLRLTHGPVQNGVLRYTGYSFDGAYETRLEAEERQFNACLREFRNLILGEYEAYSYFTVGTKEADKEFRRIFGKEFDWRTTPIPANLTTAQLTQMLRIMEFPPVKLLHESVHTVYRTRHLQLEEELTPIND